MSTNTCMRDRSGDRVPSSQLGDGPCLSPPPDSAAADLKASLVLIHGR